MAHAEGNQTEASASGSHAEGQKSIASGNYSHAEGNATSAAADYSHAEGNGSVVSGLWSHAEGYQTNANGNYSHAEGSQTIAGKVKDGSIAATYAAHAEGFGSKALCSASHAEGYYAETSNDYEHAQGRYNKTNKASTAFGNAGNTLHSIGVGTSDSNRMNAVEVMQDGKVYIKGVGNYDGKNPTDSTTQDLATVINNIPGGDSGTTNYNELNNKPKINEIELSGNLTSEDLGLQPVGDYLTEEDLAEMQVDELTSSKCTIGYGGTLEFDLGSTIKVKKGSGEAKVVVVSGDDTEHQLTFPEKTGTIAINEDVLSANILAGQTFDVTDNTDVQRALGAIITALGGIATNVPTT